jgi:hypothetical protein
VFSQSRYQSIHYSHPKLPRRQLPRLSQHPEPNRSLAMFRYAHMGPPPPGLENYQLNGPVVSVSCSIATVIRRQIAAPA